MIHRFAIYLAVASLIFLAPQPAAAANDFVYVFDTIDAVGLENSCSCLTVTGILSGQAAPTTVRAVLYDAAPQCQRFAALAMSKPGKYRFTLSVNYPMGCQLSLRTP